MKQISSHNNINEGTNLSGRCNLLAAESQQTDRVADETDASINEQT